MIFRVAPAPDATLRFMCVLRSKVPALIALTTTLCAAALAQDSTTPTTPKAPPKSHPQPTQPEPTDSAKTITAEPSPGNWQLDFTPGDFRLYTDPQTGEHFWYFTYKVVNRTGQDRWWAPKFELLVDGGSLRRSGKNVSPITMKRVEALIGNKLIADQYQVLGEIRQGESNAKEGFVVWSADSLEATEMHLFIRGMSSELVKVPNPQGEGEPILTYKTMKRDYRVSGDPADRGSKPVECEQTEWIMR